MNIMTKVLELKNKATNFIREYEFYFMPVAKFLLAMIVFLRIRDAVGFSDRVNTNSIYLLLALVSCLLPTKVIVWFAALLILVNLYSLCLEAALVGLIIFVLIYLVYFRFAPKDSASFLLTPICFHLNLPYLMPIGAGLLRGPFSFFAIVCGTVAYYFLDGIHQSSSAIMEMAASEDATISQKINLILGNVYNNKDMYLVIIILSVSTIAVFLIRQIKADHAWTLAIITGVLVQLLGLFVGYMQLNISGKTMALMLGNIVALAFGFLLQFIYMDLDYTRVERVQFEDDDYYYYVKAVPKKMVTSGEKEVKIFGNTGVIATIIGDKRADKNERKLDQTTTITIDPEDEERKTIARELEVDEEMLK